MAETTPKKYLSLERLKEYDELIKGVVAEGDADTLDAAKSYANGLVNGKADSDHTHDDRYYTETEIDTKLSGKANSSHTHDDRYYTETEIDTKISSLQSTLSGKADASHNHDNAYYGKSSGEELADTLAEVKADVDAFFKDATISAAAKDTLKEIQDYIESDATAAAEMTASIANKADKEHSHEIADVTGLQSALDGKANVSHGTHVTYSTDAPKMDGTASAGTASTVSRSDHVHPTDTSRASQTDLDALEAVVAGKADASHSHTITAEASDDDVVVLSGTNGSNKVSYTASHATSGVTAGTYKSVTVNKYGHVTGGTNPTTLAGYGITDAASKTHNHAISDITNLQTTLNNASSAISANTESISVHTDRITALETKVGDGFEPITSAEIQALFA